MLVSCADALFPSRYTLHFTQHTSALTTPYPLIITPFFNHYPLSSSSGAQPFSSR